MGFFNSLGLHVFIPAQVYLSYPANGIQVGQATRATWAAVKKYSLNQPRVSLVHVNVNATVHIYV